MPVGHARGLWLLLPAQALSRCPAASQVRAQQMGMGQHRALTWETLWATNTLPTRSVRLRCEGIWVRKQGHLRWTQCLEKKEENTLCFQQQGPGTVMPSGCHRPQGTFTRDRKLCPALSHGFFPVPAAQGRSSLSCAQDQAPSPDTGAAPQPQQGCAHQPISHPGAGACPWHQAVGAQPHHGGVNLSWAHSRAFSLRGPSSLCQAWWHSSPGAVVSGHKGGRFLAPGILLSKTGLCLQLPQPLLLPRAGVPWVLWFMASPWACGPYEPACS